MIENLADELSLQLVINNIIPIEKRKYYTYGIELILHDLFMFLVITIIAVLTKTVIISCLFSIVFCFLRAYTGGYHSNTYTGCYSITMTDYFLLLIFNSFTMWYKQYIAFVMVGISISVICKFAPIKHKNKHFDEKEKNKYKIVVKVLLIIISVLFILSSILYKEVAFTLAWAMFSTAFLMLLEIILRKKE